MAISFEEEFGTHPEPLPRVWVPHETEGEYVARLESRLERAGWDILGRQVTGTHVNGKRVRIDLVISPPLDQISEWADMRRHGIVPKFGVECKRHGGGWKDHAGLMWQAIDYRYSTFDRFGQLPILISPSPFKGNDCHVAHMLGKGRVGELDIEGREWELRQLDYLQTPRAIVEFPLRVVFSGCHYLWIEGKGITHDGRRWGLMNDRIGSNR